MKMYTKFILRSMVLVSFILIDISATSQNLYCDVNVDGTVDIADVNDVINVMLGKVDAQVVLDEIDLIGKWNVVETAGFESNNQDVFMYSYTGAPSSITFYDYGSCDFITERGGFTKGCAYFISNNNKLHLISGSSLSGFNPSFSPLAFIVEDYVQGVSFTLKTINKKAYAKFVKEDSSIN